jgi:ABC-type methionine transport system permease subunit
LDSELSSTSFFTFQFVSTILLLICLWVVKASFLAAYHTLTARLESIINAWRAIALLVLITFICCVIGVPFLMSGCTSGTSRSQCP